MAVDESLLKSLINFTKLGSSQFTLHLKDHSYPLNHVHVSHSTVPVNKPTTRGGVYFSDKFAYKMKGTVEDLSIVPLLTKKMLGPNTEFGELKITTTMDVEGSQTNLEISTNLTNSVQTPDSIELSMIIVNLKSV
ncbi:hypothetical protein AAA799E16_01389 [Marine Group I thaumarchaeote SCGC AAA799-E16]|uniref:Uncharacterized protein n=4 Tax=Marine Group I TaxID=905826 RepID=A0A087S6A5_9ARCH|nr:hypothetical protein AAA799N04_01659 [Marine Group I thaumarchaeote SCGC AAA799-N04]KER05889.1 hypothetical protein AAA799E16_01389 [Marine Group I thaumarchaeote SCGC AAA799-E16]KFM18317.1 hypothetical protein SCCGRSA3_01236 [Marine Group I thaumarchaeote SCGC RSA3]KFM21259.1 hypothetical protein AAA799B03_01211 [Marine Group I thaumarchaeote SCGC AAA799-B03]